MVVGRGCLGRPWLFRELAAAFDELPAPPEPKLHAVCRVMRRHAELLCEHLGEEKGSREFRKHVAWYTKGFALGPELRRRLGMVSSLGELDDLLGKLDVDQPFPEHVGAAMRGRTTPRRRVVLRRAGWLDDPDDRAVPVTAELGISGG